MDFFLNRHSGVSIRGQIRRMIEYAISFGDLRVGAALPSVRDLAAQLGVAPVTVSQVYAELKREGLLDARTGAGTFVADSARAQSGSHTDVAGLHRKIDDLIDSATRHGVTSSELSLLFNARLDRQAGAGRLASIIVVAPFDEATRSYAEEIQRRVGPGVSVQPVTIKRLEEDENLRALAGASDLVLTFLTLRDPVVELVSNGHVVPIRFIPSEATRLALASIDPMARVAIISHFPAFLPILRFGVRRFAAHCKDVVAATEGDPNLEALVGNCDVLIYATGAVGAVDLVTSGKRTIEYRHIPDPSDIDRLVKPLLVVQPTQLFGREEG